MKLVTWNVQWCRGCDGRVEPARIVAEARRLADFDVLCLQEIASHYPDSALAGCRGENQFEILEALLPGYTAIRGIAVDSAAEDGNRRQFGNVVFSRLPVLHARCLALPFPSDPAVRSMPRMLIDATVETPFGLVRVMTTHLAYYSARQRAAQVEAVRTHHAEASGHALHDRIHDTSGGPFHSQRHAASAIFCGDFNMTTDDPLCARLAAPFGDGTLALEDAWTVLHPGVPQAPTVGVHDRAQWPEPFACDFVYATSDLRPRLRSISVDAASAASDHQAMVLELA